MRRMQGLLMKDHRETAMVVVKIGAHDEARRCGGVLRLLNKPPLRRQPDCGTSRTSTAIWVGHVILTILCPCQREHISHSKPHTHIE